MIDLKPLLTMLVFWALISAPGYVWAFLKTRARAREYVRLDGQEVVMILNAGAEVTVRGGVIVERAMFKRGE